MSRIISRLKRFSSTTFRLLKEFFNTMFLGKGGPPKATYCDKCMKLQGNLPFTRIRNKRTEETVVVCPKCRGLYLSNPDWKELPN